MPLLAQIVLYTSLSIFLFLKMLTLPSHRQRHEVEDSSRPQGEGGSVRGEGEPTEGEHGRSDNCVPSLPHDISVHIQGGWAGAARRRQAPEKGVERLLSQRRSRGVSALRGMCYKEGFFFLVRLSISSWHFAQYIVITAWLAGWLTVHPPTRKKCTKTQARRRPACAAPTSPPVRTCTSCATARFRATRAPSSRTPCLRTSAKLVEAPSSWPHTHRRRPTHAL